VLSIDSSRRSRPAEELNAMLLVDILLHLLAIRGNIATATAAAAATTATTIASALLLLCCYYC
jgi:hypothetical protein